jgi:pimeloyl-ACP methyl ester carboxylesterase
MALSLIRIIRPIVRVASEIAPRLTGRAAFTLFCTPFQPRGLTSEQQASVARALSRLDEARAETLTIACGYIQTYIFEPVDGVPARGNALLLHGWTGRATFMTAFALPLRKLGYRVIAVDLPGHGKSSGRQLNVPLAVQAVTEIVRVNGPLSTIIAHSFGGAVAATAIAGGIPAYRPIPVKRLVLIASPNSMKDVMDDFSTMIGIGRRARLALAARIHAVAGRPVESFVGTDYLRRTATPTLVIHSVEDREVSFAASHGLAAAGSFVEHHAVEGLGHRRILYAPQVIKAVARYLAPEIEKQAPVLAMDQGRVTLTPSPIFTPSP